MSRSGDEQRFSLGTALGAFAQPTGFQVIQASPLLRVVGERARARGCSRSVGWAKRSVPNKKLNKSPQRPMTKLRRCTRHPGGCANPSEE